MLASITLSLGMVKGTVSYWSLLWMVTSRPSILDSTKSAKISLKILGSSPADVTEYCFPPVSFAIF